VPAPLARPTSGPATAAPAALGAQAWAAAAGDGRTAELTLAAGPCLVGTGRREVARLVSRTTTSTRLVSRICPAVGLASPIDIEQT